MIASIILVSSAVVAVGAVNGNEFSYTELSDGSVSITKYNGTEADVAVPSTLDGKTVSAVGANAFEYNRNITSVSLPDTVTSIGERAFNDCVNLTTVNFTDSVTTISKGAFFSCTRLSEINLPSGILTLGDGAFYDCESVVSLTIPGSVQSFGEYVFGSETALESVVIESGVTEIPPQTFIKCTKLKSVTIPNTVTLLGRKAFMECSSISELNIPDSVTELGEKVFYACRSLQSITFNGEKIGDNAFEECLSLSSLTCSDNLRSIGKNVFCNVQKLGVLSIPKNVDSISVGAFYKSRIAYISVSDENETYTSVDGVLFTKDMTKLIAFAVNSTEYTVPESVTEICDYAFAQTNNLTSISFPSVLKRIGSFAFESTAVMNVILPEGLEELGTSAFQSSSAIYANIPSSLKSIGDNAFSNCLSLESVYINDGVEHIGSEAFKYCESLSYFRVPNSITELTGKMFINTNITKALILDDNKNFVLEDNVLYNSDKTELIIFDKPDITTYTIPKTVTSITDYAFVIPNAVTTLYVPETVTSIGENAIGYYKYYTNSYYQKVNLNLISTTDSEAYKYAAENDIAFFTEEPTLNSTSLTLKGDETFDLVLNGADASNVVFNSSDTTVAAVDSNGTITAVGKGTTSVIASVSNVWFKCQVTVISDGSTKAVNPYSDYEKISISNLKDWTNNYNAENGNRQMTILDYPAIFCYTTSQYVPIVATQKGGGYMEQTLAEYGSDYGQYYILSDNLSYELSLFKLHANTLLYSGTGNVSSITGSDSTLNSLAGSVGTQHTEPAVISTSISFFVAQMFSTSSNYGTVLEILAPKGFSHGAYIKSISNVPSEYELLLDLNIKFEVVDAGYKDFYYQKFPDDDYDTGITEYMSNTVRFVTLRIVDDSQPDPESTDSTSSTSSVQPTSVASESQASTASTVSSATSDSTGSVSTGQNLLITFIVIMVVLIAAIVVMFFVRKK